MTLDPIITALRARRRELGLSQATVAGRMYVTQGRIGALETAGRSPTLDTLRRWAAALDCDLYAAPLLEPRQRQPCGTVAAARRHHAHGEPLDPQCRAAQRHYDRTHKAARRARDREAA